MLSDFLSKLCSTLVTDVNSSTPLGNLPDYVARMFVNRCIMPYVDGLRTDERAKREQADVDADGSDAPFDQPTAVGSGSDQNPYFPVDEYDKTWSSHRSTNQKQQTQRVMDCYLLNEVAVNKQLVAIGLGDMIVVDSGYVGPIDLQCSYVDGKMMLNISKLVVNCRSKMGGVDIADQEAAPSNHEAGGTPEAEGSPVASSILYTAPVADLSRLCIKKLAHSFEDLIMHTSVCVDHLEVNFKKEDGDGKTSLVIKNALVHRQQPSQITAMPSGELAPSNSSSVSVCSDNNLYLLSFQDLALRTSNDSMSVLRITGCDASIGPDSLSVDTDTVVIAPSNGVSSIGDSIATVVSSHHCQQQGDSASAVSEDMFLSAMSSLSFFSDTLGGDGTDDTGIPSGANRSPGNMIRWWIATNLKQKVKLCVSKFSINDTSIITVLKSSVVFTNLSAIINKISCIPEDDVLIRCSITSDRINCIFPASVEFNDNQYLGPAPELSVLIQPGRSTRHGFSIVSSVEYPQKLHTLTGLHHGEMKCTLNCRLGEVSINVSTQQECLADIPALFGKLPVMIAGRASEYLHPRQSDDAVVNGLKNTTIKVDTLRLLHENNLDVCFEQIVTCYEETCLIIEFETARVQSSPSLTQIIRIHKGDQMDCTKQNPRAIIKWSGSSDEADSGMLTSPGSCEASNPSSSSLGSSPLQYDHWQSIYQSAGHLTRSALGSRSSKAEVDVEVTFIIPCIDVDLDQHMLVRLISLLIDRSGSYRLPLSVGLTMNIACMIMRLPRDLVTVQVNNFWIYGAVEINDESLANDKVLLATTVLDVCVLISGKQVVCVDDITTDNLGGADETEACDTRSTSGSDSTPVIDEGRVCPRFDFVMIADFPTEVIISTFFSRLKLTLHRDVLLRLVDVVSQIVKAYKLEAGRALAGQELGVENDVSTNMSLVNMFSMHVSLSKATMMYDVAVKTKGAVSDHVWLRICCEKCCNHGVWKEGTSIKSTLSGKSITLSIVPTIESKVNDAVVDVKTIDSVLRAIRNNKNVVSISGEASNVVVKYRDPETLKAQLHLSRCQISLRVCPKSLSHILAAFTGVHELIDTVKLTTMRHLENPSREDEDLTDRSSNVRSIDDVISNQNSMSIDRQLLTGAATKIPPLPSRQGLGVCYDDSNTLRRKSSRCSNFSMSAVHDGAYDDAFTNRPNRSISQTSSSSNTDRARVWSDGMGPPHRKSHRYTSHNRALLDDLDSFDFVMIGPGVGFARKPSVGKEFEINRHVNDFHVDENFFVTSPRRADILDFHDDSESVLQSHGLICYPEDPSFTFAVDNTNIHCTLFNQSLAIRTVEDCDCKKIDANDSVCMELNDLRFKYWRWETSQKSAKDSDLDDTGMMMFPTGEDGDYGATSSTNESNRYELTLNDDEKNVRQELSTAHNLKPHCSRRVLERWSFSVNDITVRDQVSRSSFDKVVDKWEQLATTHRPILLMKYQCTIDPGCSTGDDGDPESGISISAQPLIFNIHEEFICFFDGFVSGLREFGVLLDSEGRDSVALGSISDHLDEDVYNKLQNGMFINHLLFSPDIPIQLNLRGPMLNPASASSTISSRKADGSQSASCSKVNRVLTVLSRVSKAETSIKRISNRRGIYGYTELFDVMVENWMSSVTMPTLICSLEPLSVLRNIIRGISDAMRMSYLSWRYDGRPVYGIRQGLSAFSSQTLFTLVELGEGLLQLLIRIFYVVKTSEQKQITNNPGC